MRTRVAVVVAAAIAAAGWPLIMSSSPAFADGVVSQSYTIGTGAVADVTAAVQPDTASTTANYTIGLVTPASLTAGTDTITLTDPSTSAVFPSNSASYLIVDETHSSATQTSASVSLASGSHGATIGLRNSISANDSLVVEVVAATTPSSPGTYAIEVSTSRDDVTVFSNTYQLVAASAAPTYAPTISPQLAGTSSTYTVGSFKASAAVSAGGTIELESLHAAGVSDNVGFPTSPGSYTITDSTTSSASGTPQSPVVVGPVPAASGSGQVVTLKVPGDIKSGDELTVTVKGVLNPSAAQSDTIDAAAPATATPTSGSVVIGTSVSDLTLGVSPATAGFASAAYSVGFKVTSPMAAGDKVYVTAPAGTSFASSYVDLVDVTTSTGSGSVANASLGAKAVDGSSTPNSIAFGVPGAIKAGDSLILQILDVGNPGAATYGSSGAGLAVSTQDDIVAVAAPSYSIGSGPSSVQPAVAVVPATPGASATYTITDLMAASELSAGSGSVELEGPSGTLWPSNGGEYVITDLSHASGSGTPTVSSGGNANVVTLQVGSTIASGDVFQIAVAGVINPAAGQYRITFSGAVVGGTLPQKPAPPFHPVPPVRHPAPPRLVGFPSAGVAYPDGALVQTTHGRIYLFVGGRALLITSGHELAVVRRFDHARIVRGSVAYAQTVARIRQGTAIQLGGSGPYWAAGSDGRLRAFRNHAQYLAKGYDPAQLIEVGSSSGLSFAGGVPASAASLRADGALVVAPSHGVYVFAAGRAFAISSRSELVAIARSDPARLVSGAVPTAWRTARPVNGVLFRVFDRGVFVSYSGALEGPASGPRLVDTGYVAARAIPVPGTSGLKTVKTS